MAADKVDVTVNRAAQILRSARRVVALTGAGVSTPSGIPDFRSPEYGLWQQVDPLAVASRWGFEQHPDRFYAWIRPLAAALAAARPNTAHYAMAALEREGVVRTVITQNVDGLHQAAGSQGVLEIHGHLREVVCLRCDGRERAENLVLRFRDTGQVPRCECGGVMKPNVVLFGDSLLPGATRAAENAIADGDVMLVVGSSLAVIPAGDWPGRMIAQGGELIVVNRTPTPWDDRARVVVRGDASELLPAIARELGIRVIGVRQRVRQSVRQAIDRLVPEVG